MILNDVIVRLGFDALKEEQKVAILWQLSAPLRNIEAFFEMVRNDLKHILQKCALSQNTDEARVFPFSTSFT